MAERGREYRAKNPGVQALANKRHHERHPEKRLEYKRKWMLKSQYGLTTEQFEDMRKAQSDCCAICGERIAGKNCHVDHCHQTGIVRGLLCSLCNLGIGMFKDDPTRLSSAIAYLQQNSDMEVSA